MHAEEETIGGAVQTNGEITFFDEATLSSTTESSKPSDSSDEPLSEPKPKGRFPSTGELVKASVSISGIVLIVILACVYLWKQKKRKQAGGSKQ
ncbi:hypothetical protein RV15_GL000110 [Enterococcus silesiacus]|uniref:Gram-positive cocci surface proteins LPxTG domain-containing protein n=1 Tax=Enterococcus silesiacus TaxID=332949 RepID=A0AA91JQZ0_9ENTE|nr:hypothetical protein RV15_GL000110 [Enterococcus silesiacus]